MSLAILLALALQSPAPAPQPAADSFCTRMAGQFDMAPVRRPRTFELNLLSATQRLLTGGTSAFKVAISADEDKAPALVKACGEDQRGFLRCQIGGPAVYEMEIRGKTAPIASSATDKATVEYTGSILRCTDR